MKLGTARALVAAVLLVGVASAATAQTDFTVYVSVGDSLAAGFSSGALVETHQRNSVPALIARQASVADFEQPLISEPGIPPELQLLSLFPTQLVPKPGLGVPLNLGLLRPYNNLAVPGATSIDALNTISDGGGLHDIILRGLGTQVQQAMASGPTIVTLWVGNNDVLGAAVSGRTIDGETMTPTDIFRVVYAAIVAELSATGAFIVAANLPDVTLIPYVSTIPPYVTDPITGQPVLVNGRTVPLLGEQGTLLLAPEAKVTLAASSLLAQGIGIPVALGGQARIEGLECIGCLPDEAYLIPSEVAFIQDHVRVNNQSIQTICSAAGIPVVDINALINQAATTGIKVGGVTLTADFLSGGVFSYDGVHPNQIGYALAANAWIRVINENGGNLEEVNVRRFMGLTAQSRQRTGLIEFTREAYEDLLEVFSGGTYQ